MTIFYFPHLFCSSAWPPFPSGSQIRLILIFQLSFLLSFPTWLLLPNPGVFCSASVPEMVSFSSLKPAQTFALCGLLPAAALASTCSSLFLFSSLLWWTHQRYSAKIPFFGTQHHIFLPITINNSLHWYWEWSWNITEWDTTSFTHIFFSSQIKFSIFTFSSSCHLRLLNYYSHLPFLIFLCSWQLDRFLFAPPLVYSALFCHLLWNTWEISF